jgi:hypothetical protein
MFISENITPFGLVYAINVRDKIGKVEGAIERFKTKVKEMKIICEY